MNARIFTAATIVAACCGALPAKAADPQMLNLVMPDAKVVAGVNVEQAKATPFGQYVLQQVAPQDKDLQNLQTLIGFDPRRDVRELLVASPAATGKTGVAMARGLFDPAKIAAAASVAGAKSEVYGGVTILEDPKQTSGVAFLDVTLAVFGDVANVKAAIDRRTAPTTLPAALAAQIAKWSLSQDAWAVAMAPLSMVKIPKTAPQVGGLPQQPSFQSIQQVAGGIKFGPTVILAVQAQEDTAANATALAGVIQFLANLAQMQMQNQPQADATAVSLVKSLSVATDGNQVSINLSLPSAEFEKLAHPKTNAMPRRATVKRQVK
jgi:hypothetical protein